MSEIVEVVIFISGGAPDVSPPIADRAVVIAADGGLALATSLGLHVDRVIGDLDSVDHSSLAAAERAGAVVDAHPADKDRTDLELALAHAVALGAGRIVVVGGDGGRGDHHLANVAVLASPELASAEVLAHLGGVRIAVVRQRTIVTGSPGSTVSLLASGTGAFGVTTAGLRWALHDEDLAPWSARGLSNELLHTEAEISLGHGALLVIQPTTRTSGAPPSEGPP